MLSIEPLGTNFSEILIEIHTYSFKKLHLKMSSGKWRVFCLSLNVLMHWTTSHTVHIPPFVDTVFQSDLFTRRAGLVASSPRAERQSQLSAVPASISAGAQSLHTHRWVSFALSLHLYDVWKICTWRHKEPGHQQPWYWPNSTGIIQAVNKEPRVKKKHVPSNCTAYLKLK